MRSQTTRKSQAMSSAAGGCDGRIRACCAWGVVFASLGLVGCLESEEATRDLSLHETELRDSRGTVLAPTSAAIARANAQANVDLNLLARVEIQPNELLEIYEPTPGQILISGAGAPTGKAILSADAVAGKAVEEVWSLASGSAEMPAALSAALERARQARQQSGKPTLQRGVGQAGRSPSSPSDAVESRAAAPPAAFTGGWCDTEYYRSGYGNCLPGYYFTVCMDNVWDWAYASYGGAEYVYTNVCPAIGDVTLKMTSDHGGSGYWYVREDTVRWWWQSDWGCTFDCLDVRADVMDAWGDRFHFRFYAAD